MFVLFSGCGVIYGKMISFNVKTFSVLPVSDQSRVADFSRREREISGIFFPHQIMILIFQH